MNTTYHPRGVKIHGLHPRQHPLYAVWSNMKKRCFNKKDKGWKNYGGRGIRVCDRWMHFANFASDMWPRPSDRHTIERIDNDKGYSPDNCKWATRTEQCLNRRVFTTSSTGIAGVNPINGRYVARCSIDGVTYNLGRFSSPTEADAARSTFIELLRSNREAALKMCERRARYDSSTGIKGISRHVDGGYMVRVTVKGRRLYLGYFTTIDEAKARLEGAGNVQS